MLTERVLQLVTCPVCGETTEDDAEALALTCPTCGSTVRDDQATESELPAPRNPNPKR